MDSGKLIIQRLKHECKNPAKEIKNDPELLLQTERVDLFGKSRTVFKVAINNCEYSTGWVLDNQASSCMRCNAHFGMFNWRHHCRDCGFLICKTCGSNDIIIHTLRSKASKACTDCYRKSFLKETHTPQMYSSFDTKSMSQYDRSNAALIKDIITKSSSSSPQSSSAVSAKKQPYGSPIREEVGGEEKEEEEEAARTNTKAVKSCLSPQSQTKSANKTPSNTVTNSAAAAKALSPSPSAKSVNVSISDEDEDMVHRASEAEIEADEISDLLLLLRSRDNDEDDDEQEERGDGRDVLSDTATVSEVAIVETSLRDAEHEPQQAVEGTSVVATPTTHQKEGQPIAGEVSNSQAQNGVECNASRHAATPVAPPAHIPSLTSSSHSSPEQQQQLTDIESPISVQSATLSEQYRQKDDTDAQTVLISAEGVFDMRSPLKAEPRQPQHADVVMSTPGYKHSQQLLTEAFMSQFGSPVTRQHILQNTLQNGLWEAEDDDGTTINGTPSTIATVTDGASYTRTTTLAAGPLQHQQQQQQQGQQQQQQQQQIANLTPCTSQRIIEQAYGNGGIWEDDSDCNTVSPASRLGTHRRASTDTIDAASPFAQSVTPVFILDSTKQKKHCSAASTVANVRNSSRGQHLRPRDDVMASGNNVFYDIAEEAD